MNASRPDIATSIQRLVLVLLVLLAAAERVYGIDRQSLWSDELFAVMLSYKNSFFSIWSDLVNDSHPPGYGVFMYLTLPLTGYSEFGIRLHALLFGITWVPLVFWITRRWFSTPAALIAAALVASSFSGIYFSQEARAYSMLVAVNLVNLLCFLELMLGNPDSRNFRLGFIVSSTVMLYLHYTCFVFFIAETLVYLVLQRIRHRAIQWREVARFFGIPLLLFLPWTGFMYHHLTDTSLNWAVSSVPTASDAYYTLQYLWGPDNRLLLAYLYGLAIAGIYAVTCLVRSKYTEQCQVVLILVSLLVMPVIAFFIESNIWTPIFEKRYFLMTLPIAAILGAAVLDRILGLLFRDGSQLLATLVAITVISIWLIHSNQDYKLYSQQNKDPVREAVQAVRADLDTHGIITGYTILMTDNWFEYYLQKRKIGFDPLWKFRRYDVPNKIGEIDTYLKQRPGINVFYYLAVRTPNADAATFALKQQYKLLASTTLTVPSGAISVYKFDTHAAPTDNAQDNSDTNSINEAVKLIAQDPDSRNPSAYTTLFTHDWIALYLQRNRVSFDNNWSGKKYYLDTQITQIQEYLQAHPGLSTLFFVSLRNENTDNAADMLQLQYQLAYKKTVDTGIGKLDVMKFNLRGTPVITPQLIEQLKNNPANIVARTVASQQSGATSNSSVVVMSHKWFEPYLHMNKVPVDENWDGRFMTSAFQSERVFAYVRQHQMIDSLYYLRLNDGTQESGLLPLLVKFHLLSFESVESPIGMLEIFKFSVRGEESTDNNLLHKYDNEFDKSPVYQGAKALGKMAGSTSAENYLVLTSHEWFGIYLRKLGVNLERKWSNHLFNNEIQVQNVFAYIDSHPSVANIYYITIRNPESARSVILLQSRYRLISTNTYTGTGVTIDVYRFDTKSRIEVSDSIKAPLDDSVYNSPVVSIVHDIQKSAGRKYLVIVSHDWWQPYFRIHKVQFDENWSGRLVTAPAQLSGLTPRLASSPDTSTLYYLALVTQDTQSAVQQLRKSYRLVCQNQVSAPAGQLALYKFDLGSTAPPTNTSIPECSR